MKPLKKYISAVVAVGLVWAVAGAEDVSLETDQQKASYAIGQQIGQSLKAQGITVDMPALTMSINDVLTGKDSRLTPDQMQEAMMKLQEQVMARQQEQAKKNKEDGDKFLAQNKKKKGVKVTSSGLQYEVLKSGSGPKPAETDTVKVNYRGTLIDGTEFDNSYKRGQPAQFPVTGVIKGWVEALPMMKVGSKWKLYIPSDLAYGEMGRPSIPANSVLIFEVELLEIVKS